MKAEFCFYIRRFWIHSLEIICSFVEPNLQKERNSNLTFFLNFALSIFISRFHGSILFILFICLMVIDMVQYFVRPLPVFIFLRIAFSFQICFSLFLSLNPSFYINVRFIKYYMVSLLSKFIQQVVLSPRPACTTGGS